MRENSKSWKALVSGDVFFDRTTNSSIPYTVHEDDMFAVAESHYSHINKANSYRRPSRLAQYDVTARRLRGVTRQLRRAASRTGLALEPSVPASPL